MNNICKYIVLVLATILVLSTTLQAQKAKLSTKNKKAIKSYHKGVQYLDYNKLNDAEQQFLDAITFDPKFVEARQMLGTIYEETKQYSMAIEQYNIVQQINPDFFPNNYYFLGKLLLKEGKYEEALKNYDLFLSNSKGSRSLKEDAAAEREKTEFALSLKNNPVSFVPINLGPQINTTNGEYSPTLTADEEILYFTKLRPRDQNTVHSSKFEEDFYVSRKINGQWEMAKPLGHPINSHGNEGAACISPDGMFFIFTACNRGDGFGSCDLYISKKVGGKWSAPENMGKPLNSEHWDSQPSIAPDGKTIYFASSRNGGNMDIYMSVADEFGNWQPPVNLGKPINTSKSENSPFIHPDGKTLYFMSNGHPGMGGMDIFMSKKQSDGSWSEPVNIGYPINTHKDDGFFIVSASGKNAYFASDQYDGFGHFDIYTFELPDEVKPTPVTYVKGIITDSYTGKPVMAEFQLYNLHTGELVVQSVSDEADGSFLVCLLTDADYALNVSKKGYLFYSEHYSFNDPSTKTEPLVKNIRLQPIRPGEIVVMKNIFFDFDSDKLKSESFVELTKLIQLMNENKTLHIEIRGHTDNIGSAQYNKALSERRALSVYNYLVEKGISKHRLTYKGFGDTMPVADNSTEEGRALNRRTEFRVLKNE